MATRIGRVQTAIITAVATVGAEGTWHWYQFTQPGRPTLAAGPAILLSTGWREITVDYEAAISLRLYDKADNTEYTGVSIPASATGRSTRIIRHDFTKAVNPRIQASINPTAAEVGKLLWVTARRM